MSRRGRTTMSGWHDAMWLPFLAAGQDMDRRIRTRHLQKPDQKPHDVISNSEYPFGHGGVYQVPVRRGDHET